MNLHLRSLTLSRNPFFFSWFFSTTAILLTVTTAIAQTPVEWTDLVGVSANSNSLTKTASNGWSNGGAASVQTISGDGGVSARVDETNTYLILGLSATNADANWDSIYYGVYTAFNGTLYVVEQGKLRKLSESYGAGDRLSVERLGNTVEYKRNGTTLHTSGVPSSGPLLVDVSMYSQGATLSDVMITGSGNSNSDPVITSMPDLEVDEETAYSYTVTATDSDPGDTVTLTAPLVPGWLSFDGAVLSGTPANADIGDHTVEIVATDSAGAADTQSFTITVNAAPPPPSDDDFTVLGDLNVQGTSNLGPVELSFTGEGLGPVDSADYERAPFWLKHDGFNLGLDGDQLSSNAVPFIVQNTNPNGSIVFQTGATNIDRLIIDSDGNVKVSSPAGDIPTITY